MAVSRNIAELVVKLRDEISGNSENARKRIVALDKQIQIAAATALKFTGAATAVGSALFAIVKSASNFADEMGKASQRTGVNIETLSGLRHAANLADVNFEELTVGLTKFSSGILDAARGTGEAKKGFDALGISVKNNDGTLKNSDQLLGELADRFQKMPDGVQKTALAVDLFGRAGARLIPLLNGGRDAIAAATEEARKFGLVVDEKAAKAAEQFNDNLTRLTASATGLRNVIGNALLPAFQRLIDLTGQLAGVRLEGLETRLLQRSIEIIDKQLEGVEARLARLRGATDPFFKGPRAQLQQQRFGLLQERRDLEEQLQRRLEPKKAGPKGAAPIIGPDADKLIKEMIERTKKAIGDSRDIFESEDKAVGDSIRRQWEERVAVAIETSEKIRKLQAEEYAAFEARDLEYMDERNKLRDEEFELERKHRERINELFLSFAEREREHFEERIRNMEEIVGRSFDSITDGIGKTIEGVLLGTQKIEDAFNNMFRNIALSAAQELANIFIVDPLKKTLVPGIAAGLRGLAGLFGFQTGPGEFRTVPGPANRGMPAIVHGGEVIGRPRGGAGVTQVFQFSGLSEDTVKGLRREIRMAMRQAQVGAVGEVREQRLRGGKYARTFE